MKQMTKNEFEEYLNELEVPQDDLKSEGGRIPDGANWGTWMRRNDPIAFQVGYNEECANQGPTIDLINLGNRKAR